MDTERLRTLAHFIRNQANLTDGHPAAMGPGSVNLNHEEAMLAADALDDQLRYFDGIQTAYREKKELMNWALQEWQDASEDVAMSGGTGTDAINRLARDPALQRRCLVVDHWMAINALLRQKFEKPA